ncbi:MAG: hypothetical protein QXW71_03625, partial [Thermoplasmata archaeon]
MKLLKSFKPSFIAVPTRLTKLAPMFAPTVSAPSTTPAAAFSTFLLTPQHSELASHFSLILI